jgi:hypothetical protein
MGIEVYFIIALTALVGASFWLILRKSAEKIAAQYVLLAERFTLQIDLPKAQMAGFMRPEPSVYGSYRGREMSISAPGKGLQNTRQVETVLKVKVRNNSLRAQLTTAGPLGGLRQRDSGGQGKWKSGDPGFDAAVDIRTNQGDALTALLDEPSRAWLASTLKKSKATLYIGGGNLAYARLGLIANEVIREDFEAATEFLCDLAETLEA